MDTPAASIEFTIILFLIIANGFFVLTETAIKAAHKAKLEKQSDSNEEKTRLALSLVEAPGRVLATMQIGITLTSLLLGALVGANIAPLLLTVLADIPYIGNYASLLSPVCSVILIMYLVLVLGELAPKKIALNNPEPIVLTCATLLNRLEVVARPFVHFLEGSTNFILLFIGVNPHKEMPVTEEEVRTLIEQGTEEGTFEKTEQAMVDRIFRLSDQKAYALMTPRTQLLWIDLEDSLEHNLSIIQENPDTVFPVGRDNLDDFVGILYTKDLLNLTLTKQKFDLADCVRTPMFIPKSMQSFKVLESFRESGTHEAVVLDEFGGVVGFLTMKDIISEVVGDISQGEEEDPLQIIQRDATSWLVDGLLPIDEFKEHFDLQALPEEERDHYQTMGGFITSYLGYIPAVSEKFSWNAFLFEIVDMDRVRIDKVLVTKISASKSDSESIAS